MEKQHSVEDSPDAFSRRFYYILLVSVVAFCVAAYLSTKF